MTVEHDPSFLLKNTATTTLSGLSYLGVPLHAPINNLKAVSNSKFDWNLAT